MNKEPSPEKDSSNGLILNLSGAAEVRNAVDPRQTNELRIYASKGTGDVLLQIVQANIHHPKGVWDGLLIPYSARITLFLDANANVSGRWGTSGQNPANIYQQLIDPSAGSDAKSETITVP